MDPLEGVYKIQIFVKQRLYENKSLFFSQWKSIAIYSK